jgi:transcriptional regulator with XRE-family HTH domain
MPENTESPAARILAASLRQAREASNLSLRTVSHKIGVAYSVISYWETARRVPRLEDVASFLTAVGMTGETKDAILKIAQRAQARDFLASAGTGIPEALNGVLECERTASAVTNWSPQLIPGLLQTADYARAIIGKADWPRTEVEQRVTLRVGRRDALTRRNPLHLTAVIGEGALHQRIGGFEVMADQLHQLTRFAALNSVEVRIVPEYGDWHPGLVGPFVLYEFPAAPAIVHIEHHRSGVFLFEPDSVADYKIALDTLCRRAMSHERSVQRIGEIAASMEESR